MVYVVGLMSGTSLDGIDAALVEITETEGHTKVDLLAFESQSFSYEQKAAITEVLSVQSSDVQKICSLNFTLGQQFAEAVKNVCRKAKLELEKLDLIGSHGQTIWHQPEAEEPFVVSTLQIGEPAVIAYETQTKVVSNFRTMDVAAGGLGAPLVPYTELLLYSDKHYSRLLQNIGGIGNVTVLKSAAQLDELYAFDTGPGNMTIDESCLQLFGQPYDDSGALAAAGQVDDEMLEDLMATSYISMEPPKTTGRELFGREFVADYLKRYNHVDKHDFLATMTMFTAKSIAYNYQKFILPKLEGEDLQILIGGGGAYNLTLVKMLDELLAGSHIKVCTQEDLGYSSEAKEAIAFALLAYETMQGRAANVPKATGAARSVILGNITLPPS